MGAYRPRLLSELAVMDGWEFESPRARQFVLFWRCLRSTMQRSGWSERPRNAGPLKTLKYNGQLTLRCPDHTFFMILKTGNMWQDSKADIKLFTANSFVTRQKRLVIGRGAALEALKHWPGCDIFFGAEILKECGHLGEYGVILGATNLTNLLGISLGAFQVKRHFKDDADLALIRNSTQKLKEMADAGVLTAAVNFPGIGWGRLKREDVLPIISKLPDNVEVWQK